MIKIAMNILKNLFYIVVKLHKKESIIKKKL